MDETDRQFQITLAKKQAEINTIIGFGIAILAASLGSAIAMGTLGTENLSLKINQYLTLGTITLMLVATGVGTLLIGAYYSKHTFDDLEGKRQFKDQESQEDIEDLELY